MFSRRRRRRNQPILPPPGEAAAAAPKEDPLRLMRDLMSDLAARDAQNAPPNIPLPGDPLYYPIPEAVTFDFQNAGEHMKLVRANFGERPYTTDEARVANPQTLRLPKIIGLNLMKALKQDPVPEPIDQILIGLSNKIAEDPDFGAKTEEAMSPYPTELQVYFRGEVGEAPAAAAAPAPADDQSDDSGEFGF